VTQTVLSSDETDKTDAETPRFVAEPEGSQECSQRPRAEILFNASYMLPVKDNESLSILPIPEQEDNYIWAICYYVSIILPIAFCLVSLPFHLLVYLFIYQSIHLLISFIITISGRGSSNSSNTCTNNSSSNFNRNIEELLDKIMRPSF